MKQCHQKTIPIHGKYIQLSFNVIQYKYIVKSGWILLDFLIAILENTRCSGWLLHMATLRPSLKVILKSR